MKLLSNNTLMILLVLFSGFGYIISCKHENILPPPPASSTAIITRGTAVHLPGSMKSGDSTQWKVDKAHSSVLWSTNYVGAAGLLTGRFNQFGLHDVTDAKMINYTIGSSQPLLDSSWAFYENEPAKTYFNGYVQINTSNTGEPGRDAGCNVGGMSTVPIVPGTYNLTLANLARIKSTEVKFDPGSNDYIVKLDLIWHSPVDTATKTYTPITKSLIGKLKYIPKAYVSNYAVFGFQLNFQFNCRDFGIKSTSISDKIDIQVNINLNNK